MAWQGTTHRYAANRRSIGFKNATEPYVRFPEAVVGIETMCKDLCQKLYQGDNVKYLEGPDRIPAYLTVFLENMLSPINLLQQRSFANHSQE